MWGREGELPCHILVEIRKLDLKFCTEPYDPVSLVNWSVPIAIECRHLSGYKIYLCQNKFSQVSPEICLESKCGRQAWQRM